MTSRRSARDAAVRTGVAVTSAVAVLSLGGTGAALGVLARPQAEPPVPKADPRPEPRPKRTVYVRVPAPTATLRPAARATALRPPPRAPRRAEAPAVTTSGAS